MTMPLTLVIFFQHSNIVEIIQWFQSNGYRGLWLMDHGFRVGTNPFFPGFIDVFLPDRNGCLQLLNRITAGFVAGVTVRS
ncbi:hypothetical protein D3C73_967960 [compost metagenome]